MHQTPTINPNVNTVLERYPDETRNRLLFLRQTIFEVAAQTEGVGELEETLKWGQISYLTPVTKSGTTIRIDTLKENSEHVGIYVNCQTTLVETFRTLYGELLEFKGTCCVRLGTLDDVPLEPLKHMIALTLTYHLSKKRSTNPRIDKKYSPVQ